MNQNPKSKARNSSGQASVEFLIVFAISITLIVALFFVVSQQMISTAAQKENAETQQTVDELARSIKSVYLQGEGAVETVHVVLPSTYDAAHSGIINNSLVIKTRETYRVVNFQFPVSGTLPSAPGAYDIVFTSRGSSVYAGSSLFMVSPSIISLVIPANSSEEKNVTVSNLANATLTVNGTLSWPHSEINLAASGLNFNLAPYAQRTLSLSFQSSDTSGSYSGSLSFNANSSLGNDSQSLSIYAEIPGSGGAPLNASIIAYPSSWSPTVAAGANSSSVFMVCAIDTSLASLSFTPSPGIPGAWIGSLDPISVPYNSCAQRNLTISVPLGTASGTYLGNVTFNGDSNYTQTIDLSVQVP